MTPLAAWLDDLAAATATAETAEAAFRAEAGRRIAALAAERATAYRRINLMRPIAGAVTVAEDEETAVAHGLAVLRARLGWSSDSAARSEIVGRFAPVCVAVYAASGQDSACAAPGEDAMRGDDAPVEPGAELEAFEAWYFEARGTPFWALFETYMPETPRVDF